MDLYILSNSDHITIRIALITIYVLIISCCIFQDIGSYGGKYSKLLYFLTFCNVVFIINHFLYFDQFNDNLLYAVLTLQALIFSIFHGNFSEDLTDSICWDYKYGVLN